MIVNKRHSIGRGSLGLVLALGLTGALASQGAFAMLTSTDIEHGDRGEQLSEHAGKSVTLGRPGQVLVESEPRADPLGYEELDSRVGRIPIDREQ